MTVAEYLAMGASLDVAEALAASDRLFIRQQLALMRLVAERADKEFRAPEKQS
jgi:hypothetical protein